MPAMRITRLSASFAAPLVFLLLAPGAARAADECGTLNSGNSFTGTCPDAAYASGIIYWDEANSVTLTVPGTATTTTVTTAASNMLDVGIAVRTAASASTARNIALTVGGTGAVGIVQGSTTEEAASANSRGIYVGQRSGNGATTKVNIGSGVTIGSQAAQMNGNGLHVEIVTQGAGAVTVANEADIYAMRYGVGVGGVVAPPAPPAPAPADVKVTNSGDITAGLDGIGVVGAGAITVTNEGDIAAGWAGVAVFGSGAGGDIMVTNSGDIMAGQSGIGIRNAGDAGDVTVINSGNIESISTVANEHGIDARTTFKDSAGADESVSVTHSGGAISMPSGGMGIKAVVGQDRQEADPAHDDYVAPMNTGLAKVSVTGGSINARGGAIEAINYEAGSVQVGVSPGVALTSRRNAGIRAQVTDAGNAAGQIRITQGGTIAGRTGVSAEVSRASAAGETRAAAQQPAIDVTWTGSFSHGTTADVAGNDEGRFLALDVADAIGLVREVEAGTVIREAETGTVTRYGQAAGIEAQALSWRAVAEAVAKGDDPGAFANAAAVTALFSDSADAATQARAAAIVAQFRAALTNEGLDTVPGAAAVGIGIGGENGGPSDDEIETYLSEDSEARRTLLQNILAQSLSEEEKAVLQAVATNTGLDAALNDADADFSDDYKTAVRALLDRFNVGDIKIAMTGGSIDSRGDGIRAYYATPHDRNGAIDVTIAAGATVDGADAGVYVANAGAMGSGAERILKQTVTVHGMVTGGTDAAVHLAGGGRLTVGEMGKVRAGSSGRAILVNDPGRSEIVIRGEVRGGSGAGPDATAAIETTGGGEIDLKRTGKVVLSEGATNAIRTTGSESTNIALQTDGPVTQESADAAVERLGGGGVVGNGPKTVRLYETDEENRSGMGLSGRVREDGAIIFDIPVRDMVCDDASDGRCRLYEALPSALLGMNGLPAYRERTAAARNAAGGWARVEAAYGKWKAARSTQADVSYDRRRTGLRAGMDMAMGENLRLGMSAHGLTGSAEMAQNGGKVELTGMGIGVNATAQSGGFHIDAQLAVTRYDVELTSSTGRQLKDGAKGTGYALALEAGRSMAVGRSVSVTPRAGLAWSRVSLRDFTDSRDTPVSMKDAGSFTGSAGVGVEMEFRGGPRLFGSVDVMREFSEDTETDVSGTLLKASAKATSVRVGLGAAHSWGEGRYALQGSAGYAAAGGGNNEFGGGVSFAVRF